MQFVIKSDSLYSCDRYGNTIRKICDEAIEARFQDTNIVVRTRKENQLRDKYGNLIRRY